MKFKGLLFTIFLICGLTIGVCANGQEPKAENIVVTGVAQMNISARTMEKDSIKYICIDDVLKASGFELGWESYHGAVIVYNPSLQCNMYVYLSRNEIFDGREFIAYSEPIVVYNGYAYITEKMLADLTRGIFVYEIKPPVVESPFDKYRRSGNVDNYNGIYLLGQWYAFEMVDLTEEMLLDYALAVNTVAENLPEDVNVYNMAIPNSAEYYAPKIYSTGLREKYHVIYENLSERVQAVDIYQALFDHADESIFFNTDHHWTQRGAYYAYECFTQLKGIHIEEPHLKTCTKFHTQNVVGSFASLMKGTPGEEYLKVGGELLERFIPPYNITKEVYYDCDMQKLMGTGPLINKYLHAYGTFLGGDVPVAKLHNKDKNDGSTLCIIKDSYANAFATWAICDYEYVYLVDIRCFNGANGMEEPFTIKRFQENTGFDDLLIMSYPNTIYDYVLRNYIKLMG